jgi:hypothetical protein
MIAKSDWQTANEQLMAEERRRAGDPPTAEEMLAYTRGELSSEEEARVRERLLGYPDLVRTLTEPFPEPAQPGDPDFLSDIEFARRFREGSGRVDLWRYATAIAASVAVVFGLLLWQAGVRRLEPRVVGEQQVLFPDGRRGTGIDAVALAAGGDSVLLIARLIGQRDFDRYRIAIVDANSGGQLWASDAPPPEGDSFVLLVPRRFLKPGLYRLVIYGVIGKSEERLATYSLRVPAP